MGQIKYKWNDEDKFAFATQRLRSTKMTNKKREASRKACRGRIS